MLLTLLSHCRLLMKIIPPLVLHESTSTQINTFLVDIVCLVTSSTRLEWLLRMPRQTNRVSFPHFPTSSACPAHLLLMDSRWPALNIRPLYFEIRHFFFCRLLVLLGKRNERYCITELGKGGGRVHSQEIKSDSSVTYGNLWYAISSRYKPNNIAGVCAEISLYLSNTFSLGDLNICCGLRLIGISRSFYV